MSKKLSFFDKAFWITETNNNPKHVAGLQMLSLPEHADEHYIKTLVAELKSYDEAESPFSDRVIDILKFPLKLTKVKKLAINYHVQHHQIDDVMNKQQLNEFVARLHEQRLDRKQPLWQYHVIETPGAKQFCIYFKIHHMYGDGVALIRWFQAGMADQPDSGTYRPVWAVKHIRRKRREAAFSERFKSIGYFFLTIFNLLAMMVQLLAKLLRINRHYMPLPFTGKKTVLTGQVKKGRTFARLDLPMDRVVALSKRTRATVNEILLTSFDIGVHRFLKDYGHTFDKPLISHMPIDLRRPGEQADGNKIGIALIELAHGKKDPYRRLQQIILSHKLVKRAAKKVYPAAFSYYTVIWQGIALLLEALRLSGFLRPLGNILISNVPGPKEIKYLKDCRVESTYPISTLTPGGGVNITLLTYNGTANVGLVCCDTEIKSLEPMAHYFAEAFLLLERCIDDPSVTIDDIGELPDPDLKSIVVEEPHHFDEVIH